MISRDDGLMRTYPPKKSLHTDSQYLYKHKLQPESPYRSVISYSFNLTQRPLFAHSGHPLLSTGSFVPEVEVEVEVA